jgi:phage terminase large subunit-like protein
LQQFSVSSVEELSIIAWATKLCSWKFPNEEVAHFDYEILYGSEGGGEVSKRAQLLARIIEALANGDREAALSALLDLTAADPDWSVWLGICDWVWATHANRAAELILVLLAQHRCQPFASEQEGRKFVEEWIASHPLRPRHQP